MKLVLAIISMAFLTTDSLAIKNPFSRTRSAPDLAQAPSGHVYNGEKLPDDLFDSTQNYGLNLEKIDACLKRDRQATKGGTFCNAVVLFAKNKQALNTMSKTEQSANKMIKEGLQQVQNQFACKLLGAGLSVEQLYNIPPLGDSRWKKNNPQ